VNTVYGAILSPFVRKVLMTLEHKNVPYENLPVIPYRTPVEFDLLSPLRKIPAFSDEYTQLADSSIICDYLEHKYPQSPLYPRNPADRAQALWMEEFADTALQELLGPGFFFEKMVAPVMLRRPADEARMRRSLLALPRHQDYLERKLSATTYLLGQALGIADLAVPSVFLNARYAGYLVDPERWPKLSGYLERMRAEPLYQRRITQEAPALAALVPRPPRPR
jgi:glutathione S-transferase